MDTSKSNSQPRKSIAGALIFSGRPDPTWIVPPNVVDELERLWASLEITGQPLPAAPALGYRGCFLREDQNREWVAFGGVVELKRGGQSEIRRDKERAFEKTLLASAPPGLLPPGLP